MNGILLERGFIVLTDQENSLYSGHLVHEPFGLRTDILLKISLAFKNPYIVII